MSALPKKELQARLCDNFNCLGGWTVEDRCPKCSKKTVAISVKTIGVIQRAAMAMGSTDEWTDQETMIADFEQRFDALRAERAKLEAAVRGSAIQNCGEGPWADARRGGQSSQLAATLDAIAAIIQPAEGEK